MPIRRLTPIRLSTRSAVVFMAARPRYMYALRGKSPPKAIQFQIGATESVAVEPVLYVLIRLDSLIRWLRSAVSYNAIRLYRSRANNKYQRVLEAVFIPNLCHTRVAATMFLGRQRRLSSITAAPRVSRYSELVVRRCNLIDKFGGAATSTCPPHTETMII